MQISTPFKEYKKYMRDVLNTLKFSNVDEVILNDGVSNIDPKRVLKHLVKKLNCVVIDLAIIEFEYTHYKTLKMDNQYVVIHLHESGASILVKKYNIKHEPEKTGILKSNLYAALLLCIQTREKYEKEVLQYTEDSIFLAGIKECTEALEKDQLYIKYD